MASSAETGDDNRHWSISQLLMHIGLSQYAEAFEDNMVDIEHVEMMSEDDFKMLGILQMGVRLKIKQACRNYLKGKESPVLSKFLELEKSKKHVKTVRNQVRNEKMSRKIYLGWKHATESGPYGIMKTKDGGGQQIIDVAKETTYKELVDLICGIYFPQGVSQSKGLEISDLDIFIASFNGTGILEQTSETEFSVGLYFKRIKSTPVRMYLHSRPKHGTSEDAGKDTVRVMGDSDARDHTNNDQTEVCSPVQPECMILDVQRRRASVSLSLNRDRSLHSATRSSVTAMLVSTPSPAVSETQNPEVEDCNQPEPVYDSVMMIPDGAVPATTSLSHSDFLPAGTPTVLFRSDPSTTVDSAVDLDLETESFSEDDLQEALRRSLEPASFEGILNQWVQTTFKQGEAQAILLKRDNVLKCTLRATNKNNFQMDHPIKVVYAGEMGEDFGGPQREFLRDLMCELQDDILVGPDANKQFCHNIQKVSDNRYFTAGQLISFSVLHGGPGLPVLNPSLYNLITNRDIDLNDIGEDCILDEDVNSRLSKVKTAKDHQDLQEELNKTDWYLDLGIAPHTVKFDEKDVLLKTLVKNELLYKVQSEIDQFKAGMDTVGGLFSIIADAPETMKRLLTDVPDQMTFDSFRSLYQINFSPEGSNQRCSEQDTIYCFEAFLMDCQAGETGVTLDQLLGFWTGANKKPPLGFPKLIEVEFISREGDYLPVARTCGMVLELKRGEKNPDKFAEDMKKAVLWCQGFHIA